MRVRTEVGSGEMVVFVHGAGVAGWMWKKQVESLVDWRRVVVDLADHGADRATPFTTLEAEADAIVAHIRTTTGKAHLVGHSLGAKIVLDILARSPEVAMSAVVSSALVRPSLVARMMDNHTLNVLSVWMLRTPWLARLQAQQFSFPDADMTENFLADVGVMTAENLDRPVAAFCGKLSPPAGLEQVRCPVLLTVGEKELGVMQDSVQDLRKRMPHAETWTIPGAQHNYPWTHADAYSSRLKQWLGPS